MTDTASHEIVEIAMSTDSTTKKGKFPGILRRKCCNVSAACRALGIDRKTYYNWRKKDPVFAEDVAEVGESMVDMVEGSLLRQISDGSTTATIFFLCNKGKHRGWQSVQKIKHATEGGRIVLKVVTANGKD